jgi:plastocyanin
MMHKRAVAFFVLVLFAGSVGFYLTKIYLKHKSEEFVPEEKHLGYEEPAPSTILKIIEVKKNCEFKPNPFKIKVDTTIAFENEDSITHTLISNREEGNEVFFDSGAIKPRTTMPIISYSKTGTFTYFCQDNPNEKGTIIVEKK